MNAFYVVKTSEGIGSVLVQNAILHVGVMGLMSLEGILVPPGAVHQPARRVQESPGGH